MSVIEVRQLTKVFKIPKKEPGFGARFIDFSTLRIRTRPL
jgi:hypothetical protein